MISFLKTYIYIFFFELLLFFSFFLGEILKNKMKITIKIQKKIKDKIKKEFIQTKKKKMPSPRKAPVLKTEQILLEISNSFEFYKRASALRTSELEKRQKEEEEKEKENNDQQQENSDIVSTMKPRSCEDDAASSNSSSIRNEENEEEDEEEEEDETDSDDRFHHETSLSSLSHKTLVLKNIIVTSSNNNINNNGSKSARRVVLVHSNRLFVSIYDPVYSEEDRRVLGKMVRNKKYTTFNRLDEDEEVLESDEPIERWDHEITAKSELVSKKIRFELGTHAYNLTIDDKLRFQFESKQERDQLESLIQQFILFCRDPEGFQKLQQQKEEEEQEEEEGKIEELQKEQEEANSKKKVEFKHNNDNSSSLNSSSPRKSKIAKKESSPDVAALKALGGKKSSTL
jgi:hypothetical protein